MTYKDLEDFRYELPEEEAEAILAESPDTTLVVDWLAGVLSEEQARAVRLRLHTDQGFHDLAMPLIEAWEAVPPFRERMSVQEKDASWRRFQAKMGIAPEPAPAVEATVSPRAFRRLVLAVASLLVMVIPGAGWLGYRLLTFPGAPGLHVAVAQDYSASVALDRVSSAALERGARLYWSDGADALGRREMMLVSGTALFALDSLPGVTWVVLTPAGRLTIPNAVVQVDVRDPQLTFVRVDRGTVTLEATGTVTVTPPLTLRPGDRGLLVHSQPPALATR